MQSLSKLYKKNNRGYSLLGAVGSFNKIALTIDVPSPNNFSAVGHKRVMTDQDMAYAYLSGLLFHERVPPPNDSSVVDLIRTNQDVSYAYLSSLLLHERAHWLQSIGTTTGIFLSFLSDIQEGLILRAYHDRITKLQPSDFPLIDLAYKADEDWVSSWQAFELLYNIVNGGLHVIDIKEMSARAKPFGPGNALVLFSNLCGSILQRACTKRLANSDLLSMWPNTDIASEFEKVPIVPDDNLMAYGALHLMEATSFLNESYELLNYMDKFEVLNPRIESIYGKARKIFYENIHHLGPSGVSEVMFATIIDYALNPPLPPVCPYPLSEDYKFSMNKLLPFVRFVTLAKVMREFKWHGGDVKLNDHIAVHNLIEEIYSFLEKRGMGAGIIAVFSYIQKALKSYNFDAQTDLYELDELGVPRPKNKMGRFEFLLKRTLDAVKIRCEKPELFILPVSIYSCDKKEFYKLYDPISEPLLRVGQYLQPYRNKDSSWFYYFFLSAVNHDLGRWIVYCSFHEIVDHLKNYCRLFENQETGINLVLIAVYSFFQNEIIVKHIDKLLRG